MSPLTPQPADPSRKPDLSDLVYKDDLTDLYNRRYLRRYLGTTLESPQPYSLLMLDVDHFKRINDTQGHKCGDQVLIHMANVLRVSFRSTDTVVRYAGDEFIVALPNTEKQMAANLAERMRKELLGSPFVFSPGQPPIVINVSVGVASFPADANNVDGLIEQADRALYHSKRNGRGRISLAGDVPSSAMTELDLLRRFPCPVLVGRREMFEQMSKFLPIPGDSTVRQMQFVLLKGPPGVGKSRLLSEVREAALKTGVAVRIVTCSEEDTLLPYHCVTRTIEDMLSRDPDTVERITERLPDEGIYCLKRAMPHLPIKRDTGKMTLSAQMQRQVMLKAMVDLMTNLAQIRPLAIIFDELQNVDLGSMTLALALRNRGVQNVALFGALLPSALLEAVRRQNSLGIFISVVKSASFFREFDIPPLTKEETQEMIAAILPGLATRPELSEMIWSASGGNPLFIQAHLKSLIAQGQISVRDGVLTLELPTGVKSFQNAEEAVASNLAALDPETKELVTDAAVAGPVVELQLLQAIAGLNEGQTQEILDKAQRAAILAMSEEEGDRVKFASETVREVTYLQADEGRRRRTHGQIGELVEQQHKDNPDAVAAELAYHYGRSDRVEKATEYQSRVKALGRAIFDTSETMLMASKKVARKIPESERMLSSSSAGKVVPFARAFIEAVAKTRVAAAPDVGRAEAQAVRMQLNFILDNDDPLTLSVEGETLIANALTIAGNLEDKTPQELRQLLLGHNAKSLTFQMGVDEREIELLLNALARRVDVHVGFLWPIWLGENQIRNIYIEQEVQTARLIREGEGAVVSFSGMGAGAAAAKASGPAVAEAEGAAEPQRRVKKPGARPASKALSDEGVAQFVKSPVAGIASKRVREELLVAFEAAMAAGDRDALQSLVDSLKVCLTDASIEVRLYAGGLMEAVLPRCVTHKCEYLEDMMVGILCEVLAREQDARAYGRLARIACEAASRTLQREDYDAVRRLVTAFSRFDPVSGGRGIRAQQLSAIQHLLNSAFFDLLMDDLTSGDPTRTSAANFVLASFEDLVVPRVVRALTESDSLRMRLAVVSVLKSQISATLPHIKEQLLTNANATALKRIVSVIGELLPGSRELIQTVLDHPSEDLATEAVSAFLKLPAPECAAEIAALLKHPRAIIRLEALRVIGDTKIAEGEEAVRQMLSSSSEEVRREVCITLGKLGSTRSVPELCRILRRRGFFGLFGGVPPAVRGAAAWALGQIRDQRALPYLRKAASDRNAIVQATAKLALQTFETS